MAKEDPREVDWAEKQIKSLRRKVASLQGQIGDPDHDFFVEGQNTLVEALTVLLNRRLDAKTHLRVFDRKLALLEEKIQPDNPNSLSFRLRKLEQRFERDAGDGTAQPLELWMEGQVNQMLDRLVRLSKQIHFETSEDNARIKSLEEKTRAIDRRVVSLEEDEVPKELEEIPKILDQVKWLEDQQGQLIHSKSPGWEGVLKRLNEIEQRMFDYGIPVIKSPRSDWVAAEEGTLQQFGVPWVGEVEDEKPWLTEEYPEPEFSPPIGKSPEQIPSHVVIEGVEEMRMGAYVRGEANGARTALGKAEDRIRRHMGGSFSEGTIRDVIGALWGPDLPVLLDEGS